MATLGNIIFWSMIVLIIVFTAIIVLFFVMGFQVSSISSALSLFSNAESTDRSPVANLGENILLSCLLPAESDGQQTVAQAVTWTKAALTGLVYKYNDNSPHLEQQNPQFTGRTQVFPDAMARGNASLLVSGVTRDDRGEYTCSVTATTGEGSVIVDLRTAVYSPPLFSINDGTLAAMAPRWQPEPQVTWLAFNGTVLDGITQFSRNPEGIYSFHSSLQRVTMGATYTFQVQNLLVTATSTISLNGSGIAENTEFSFNAGSSLSPSNYVVPLFGLLMCAIISR